MRRENHVQRSRMSKMGLTDGAQSGPRVGDMVQPLGHKVVQVFAPKRDAKQDEAYGLETHMLSGTVMSPMDGTPCRTGRSEKLSSIGNIFKMHFCTSPS